MTPESPTAAAAPKNNRRLYHHGAMTTCLALRLQVDFDGRIGTSACWCGGGSILSGLRGPIPHDHHNNNVNNNDGTRSFLVQYRQ